MLIEEGSQMAAKMSDPVETLTFEQALKELESIVSRLEQGQVDLEDSIALYERGQALKTRCEERLRQAESRLERIVRDANGSVTAQPVVADARSGVP
jgi:exodeoxyribonuclease VII small subunit